MAWKEFLFKAPNDPLPNAGNGTGLLGSRDGHIAEPPLLVHAIVISGSVKVWKQVFLASNQKDMVKL